MAVSAIAVKFRGRFDKTSELRARFDKTAELLGRFARVKTSGIWVSDEAPDWSDATLAQKLVSGFWTDDNDLPNASEPDSIGESTWGPD